MKNNVVPETVASSQKPVLSQRFLDVLFGYDFYIAHRSVDGKRYAEALYNELTAKGNERDCFLDVKHFGAGQNLPWMQSRALRKTSRLIVIVTPRAHDAAAEYLVSEVREFRQCHPNGVIVPIGSLRTLQRKEFPGSPLLPLVPNLDHADICVLEDEADLLAGKVGSAAVTKLLNDFSEVRKATRRLRWIQGVATLMFALAVVACLLAVAARESARRAEKARVDSEVTLGRLYIENGRRAIESEHDVGAGLLWNAKVLETTVEPLTASRASARMVLSQLGPTLPSLLVGHKSEIWAMSLSPDGRTLATGSSDATVRLWDLSKGRERTDKPLPHQQANDSRVNCVAFSPDGRTLVSGTGIGEFGGHVFRWDSQTGLAKSAPQKTSVGAYGITFGPDGTRFASYGILSGVSDLWNATDGTQIGRDLSRPSFVLGMAFGPDGRSLIAVGARPVRPGDAIPGPGDAWLWTWDQSKLSGARLPCDDPSMLSDPQFSPDGTVLVATAGDAFHLWNLGDRDQAPGQGGAFTKHQRIPLGKGKALVTFTPDGKAVATINGQTERFWDPTTGLLKGQPVDLGTEATAMRYSPDGRLVATLGSDNVARVYDARTGRAVRASMTHDASVTSMTFNNSGTILITSAWDGVARLWNMEPWQPVFANASPAEKIEKLAFSRDGSTLVGGGQGYIYLWDARTGRSVHPPVPVKDQVKGLALNRDGTRLAIVSFDAGHRTGALSLWSVSDWKQVGDAFSSEGPIYAPSFMPDGRTLGFGRRLHGSLDAPHEAGLWNSETRQFSGPPIKGAAAIAISPDGNTLAACSPSLGGGVRLHDAKTLRAISVDLPLEGRCFDMRFSGDGRTLVMAGEIGIPSDSGRQTPVTFIWDLATARLRVPPLKQIHNSEALAISDVDGLLATSDGDRCRLWDLETGQPCGEIPVGQKIVDTAFSPDGRLLATAGEDGSVRVWSVPSAVAGTADRLRLSVELRTMRTIDNGLVRKLSVNEYQLRREALQNMGGDVLPSLWSRHPGAEPIR